MEHDYNSPQVEVISLFHSTLSSAITHAWLQLIFNSAKRFFIMDIHVVRGLPFGFAEGSRVYCNADFAGQSFGSLIICPNQLSCLFIITLLHGLIFVSLYTFSFVTTSGYLTFRHDVLISLRWK